MMQFWHGGQRWVDRPEIQPPRQGRYECGPGIYLTNQYSRARTYAKGGGVTTLVSIRENITWLEHKQLTLTAMKSYVRDTPGFRKRHLILRELEIKANQLGRDLVSASYLVNLCVDYEVLSGCQGINLANWLVAQGVDASLHVVDKTEHWVIVFNPEIIEGYQAVPAAKVSLNQRMLPLVNRSAR